MAPAAPVSVLEVGAAARAGRIWVAGGLRADGSASDEVVVFDPASGTWTPGPKLPEPVHHASLVSDGDGLLLVGGYAPSGPTTATRRLADGASAWAEGPPLPDAPSDDSGFAPVGTAVVRKIRSPQITGLE